MSTIYKLVIIFFYFITLLVCTGICAPREGNTSDSILKTYLESRFYGNVRPAFEGKTAKLFAVRGRASSDADLDESERIDEIKFVRADQKDWDVQPRNLQPVYDIARLRPPDKEVPRVIPGITKFDPPWSYHGKIHPLLWHTLSNKWFLIPDVPNYTSSMWGYSSMRLIPPKNIQAWTKFQVFEKEFEKLTCELFEHDDPDDSAEVPHCPEILPVELKRNATEPEIHFLMHFARVRVQMKDKVTSTMVKWLRDLQKMVSWNRDDNEGKNTETRDGLTLDLAETKRLYRLAKGYLDINREHLNPNGEKWKQHVTEYGLPEDTNYCWWNEQSPIDINTTTAEVSTLTDYEFGDNAKRMYKIRMFLPDDATTLLTLTLEESRKNIGTGISITGGGLTGADLTLERIHIKYGDRDHDYKSGSEHMFNGKGYAMELQMIFTIYGFDFWNEYHFILTRTLNDWAPYKGKLVMILSVLVNVVDIPKDPTLFDPLASAARQFRREKAQSGNKPLHRGFISNYPVFRFTDFIPSSAYYLYRGSLTHPPCLPYVMWSVYEEPLEISKLQYEAFIRIPAEGFDDNDLVADNVRHVDQIVSRLEDPNYFKDTDVIANLNARLNRRVTKSYHRKGDKDNQFDNKDKAVLFDYTEVK